MYNLLRFKILYTSESIFVMLILWVIPNKEYFNDIQFYYLTCDLYFLSHTLFILLINFINFFLNFFTILRYF